MAQFKIILTFILSFCVSILFAQQYTPMTAAGYAMKRVKVDSTLHLPSFCGIPTLRNSTAINGALAMDTCNNKLYKWTNQSGWSVVGQLIDTTLYVKYTDTSSMLSKYLRKSDTASLSNRINLKVNISDTAVMLSPYLRKIDTASLSNRIDLKLNITDTANKWITNVYRKVASDSVFYVKGGSNTFAFKDSTGGGGGQNGRFGNDTATIVMIKVHNDAGTTLTNGEVVYLATSGTNSDAPSVKRAKNTGDATSANTFGFVSGSIPNNDTGYIIISGKIEKLNTAAYSNGTILYLDSIAGKWTSTKPKAPYHLVYLGAIVKSNAGNGTIMVKPQNGYELDEIHDVQITTPLNNQIIVYSDTQSIWKNRNVYTIVDTTKLSARINLKVNISDTAAMLTPYQRANDAVTLSTTQTITGQKTFNPSVTAASLIARGTYFTPSLTAAANNDTLIGLDIKPTFTNGAFTGVTNANIRLTNGTTSYGILSTGGAEEIANEQIGAKFNTSTTAKELVISLNNTSGKHWKIRSLQTGAFDFRNITDATTALSFTSTGAATFANNITFNVGNSYLGNSSTINGLWFQKSGSYTTSNYSIYSDATRTFINGTGGGIYFRNSNSDQALLFSTGNLAIGSTTDAGYKLDVNGTARVQGALTTTGSITAATAIARGSYFNQTLVAAANNDTLVGLDIKPTFTNGAFTGVRNTGLRVIHPASFVAYNTTPTHPIINIRNNAASNNNVITAWDNGGVTIGKNTAASNANGYALWADNGNSTGIGAPNLTSTNGIIIDNGSSGVRFRMNYLSSGALELYNYSTLYNGRIGITTTAGTPTGTALNDIHLNSGTAYSAYNNVTIGGTLGVGIKVFGSSLNTAIGTTTDAGYKLDVNGTGRFQSGLTGTTANFSGNAAFGTTQIGIGGSGGFGGGASYWVSASSPHLTLNTSISGGGIQFIGSVNSSNTYAGTSNALSTNTPVQNYTAGITSYYNQIKSTLNATGNASANTMYVRGFYAQSGTLTPNSTTLIPIGFENESGTNLLNSTSGATLIGGQYGSLVASAKLQVESTTQGFLPPRMTTTQRTSITSPAEGLIVYDLTLHKLYIFTGTVWEQITSL